MMVKASPRPIRPSTTSAKAHPQHIVAFGKHGGLACCSVRARHTYRGASQKPYRARWHPRHAAGRLRRECGARLCWSGRLSGRPGPTRGTVIMRYT